MGIMGITRILPIVFSIILFSALGSFQDVEAGGPLGDYGDAPVSYGTPSHTSCGPTLGPSCDTETNSQHSADASGDGADDDGVSFNGLLIQDESGSYTLKPRGSLACVNGWIDIDQSGTFDASERLLTGGPDPCFGVDRTFSFNIPATLSGDTFARFRVQGTFGTLTPTGGVATGEVEDYKITILPACTVPPTLTVPADITAEATDPSGTTVFYSTSAIDCHGRNVGSSGGSLSCNPSGTNFPLGDTTVTCTATDNRGNQALDDFMVTVVDTTPPVISVTMISTFTDLFTTPESVATPPDYNSFLAPFVTDLVDPNPTITSNAPLEYPIGDTIVSTMATDASGNSFTRDVTVTLTPNDSDGDGIVNAIDPDGLFSNLIEDLPEGTTGEIITRGGQTALIIFEEPDPDGIRFVNDPMGGNPAILQVCENAAEITIDGDDSGIVTCGSVEVGILTGSVEASFTTGGPPVTSTMTAPEMLLFEPGTLTITNTGAVPATITFLGKTIVLAPGESITFVLPSSGKGSTTAQDPNLGDVRHGTGHPNGFCMNQNCMDVDGYFNHFPEKSIAQGSTQAFTILVNCPRGADTCNHIEIAGTLPDADFYDYRWAATVDRQQGTDNWDLTTTNTFEEIGDVSVSIQEIGQSFVSATFNIPFDKSGSIGTPDGNEVPQENNRHIHVTVWDNSAGNSNYIFNDGVLVEDIYAYPQTETTFDAPLEYEQLCLNENSNKRHTCAFDKVKDWTIKNAEEKLQEIYDEKNYKNNLE